MITGAAAFCIAALTVALATGRAAPFPLPWVSPALSLGYYICVRKSRRAARTNKNPMIITDGPGHMNITYCDLCGMELEDRYGPVPYPGHAGQPRPYKWCAHCKRGFICPCSFCRGTDHGPFRMHITIGERRKP